jgi:hypothetical protein
MSNGMTAWDAVELVLDYNAGHNDAHGTDLFTGGVQCELFAGAFA